MLTELVVWITPPITTVLSVGDWHLGSGLLGDERGVIVDDPAEVGHGKPTSTC